MSRYTIHRLLFHLQVQMFCPFSRVGIHYSNQTKLQLCTTNLGPVHTGNFSRRVYVSWTVHVQLAVVTLGPLCWVRPVCSDHLLYVHSGRERYASNCLCSVNALVDVRVLFANNIQSVHICWLLQLYSVNLCTSMTYGACMIHCIFTPLLIQTSHTFKVLHY